MKSTTKDVLRKQRTFWQHKEATVNGMLDGFEAVDPVDVETSKNFIDKIWKGSRSGHRVLDVGAGIGRVAKRVIIPAGFTEVDLLDFSKRYLEESYKFVDSLALKETFCTPMNKFDFCEGKRPWDMIWVQWTAIYLPDNDFIKFFRDACASLTDAPNACVVLKENITLGNADPLVDKSDASVTRSDEHLKRLWAEAGVEVFYEERVEGFPAELFPVYMYAMRAATTEDTSKQKTKSSSDKSISDNSKANKLISDDSTSESDAKKPRITT